MTVTIQQLSGSFGGNLIPISDEKGREFQQCFHLIGLAMGIPIAQLI